MEQIIYINREDYRKAEEEERDSFIRSCLENMGLNSEPNFELDNIWPPNNPLTIESKIKLQNYLKNVGLEIIYDGDGGYKIYAEDDVIAEWFKPTFVLREDGKARTIAKRFFYEMTIRYEKYYNTEEEEDYE